MLKSHLVAATILSAGAVCVVAAASRTFAPDVIFKDSTLKGWHVVGQARWRAESGTITGTSTAGDAGWLVLDRSFQDVGFSASFRCSTSDCRAGVLLRAEKIPAGGMKGIFVSLSAADPGAYAVTVDAAGRELTREALKPTSVEGRTATALRAGRGGEGRENGSGGAAAGRGRGSSATSGRGSAVSQAPDSGWNTIDVILDVDVLRPMLNGSGSPLRIDGDGGASGYGPLALYVGGSAEVAFKDVSYKDLQPKAAAAEIVSSHFRMQRLNEFFYSWSPAVADINRDGILDIVAGPYYYLGPDYAVSREIYVPQTFNPSTQFPVNSRVKLAYDFTGDGWPDVLSPGLTDGWLYVNPKGESRRWDKFRVISDITSEVALLKDMDGDGIPEVVFAGSGVVGYAKPDPARPTAPWIIHAVSRDVVPSGHGLGVGDINGDGRPDILDPNGWWEQPAKGSSGPWPYHPTSFGGRGGGAEMAVYDVNGDGLNDVVTSLAAHGFGLAWFEQKRNAHGEISFVQHTVMDDFATRNAANITFSQLHGLTSADVDGDGIPDVIVGKRSWSHNDGYTDPDPYGPAVLYVYRTVRNPKAPGGAELVPELIHNRSGVGSRIDAVDLNNDGAIDIITSANRGTFVFWGKPKSHAAPTARAR